ncbi:hypothetical protein Tco_1393597 [Tanacetum coccineum]
MPLLAAIWSCHRGDFMGAGASVPAGDGSSSPPPPSLSVLQLSPKHLGLRRCIDQIRALETELKDTKKTLGGAVLTLVGRVKHLEVRLKKRKRTVVLSDSEDERGCPQGWAFDIEGTPEHLSGVSKNKAQTEVMEAFRLSPGPPRPQLLIGSEQMFLLEELEFLLVVECCVSTGSVLAALAVSKEILVASTVCSFCFTLFLFFPPLPQHIPVNMEDERIGADMAKKVQAEEECTWPSGQPSKLYRKAKRQQDVNASKADVLFSGDDGDRESNIPLKECCLDTLRKRQLSNFAETIG